MSRRFAWVVARTSICNLAAAAAAAIAGVLIARSLGPSARGEYAAIMAWFGAVLVLGQLGQTAAITFFVARDPDRARDYVATSRAMMVASGMVALGIGLLAAPLLAAGSGAATAGYRLMFATCAVCFASASYVFSLQATRIDRWNLTMASQPVAYLVIVAGLHLAGRLNLMTALAVLSATTVGQAGLAYWLCAREGLTGGRARRSLARPLSRYGLSQLAAAAPTLLTTRLAMLVLSLAVPSAALGQYAVAASVTALAMPVVSAVGNVSFPKIASRTLPPARLDRLQRFAVVGSAVTGIVLMLPVVVSAPVLVPLVFGAGFRDAVPLVLLLAPGGVLLACGRVCADLLTGHGRPLAVARAQAVAALSTVALLATLVPWLGVIGAAITESVAAAVALVLLLRALHRVNVRRAGRTGRHRAAVVVRDRNREPMLRQ
jgi:O-antigen/teichoic acid export membrane protein